MKDPRSKPFLLCMLTYFCVGSMVLTANIVMKPILAETGWSDSQGAMMITCLSVGFLVSSVFSSSIMARIGRKQMNRIGNGIMCGSFLFFAAIPVPSLYYAFLFIAGLSWGSLNVLVNTVAAELYDGSTSRLNVMNACYALGAVLFPLLIGFLIKSGISWRIPAMVVSALGAGLLLFSFSVRLPEQAISVQTGSHQKQSFAFLKETGFYLSFITFFAYVGTETAVSSWLSIYLSQNNAFFAENIPSETMVSLMWVMMLIGRLVFAAVGVKVNRRVLLVVLSAGFLAGLSGVVVFCASTGLAVLSVIVMGLSMSAMYATIVSNASRYVTSSPVASGILFGSSGLGSSILPLLAGLVSDTWGLRAGMSALCICLVMLLICSLFNLKAPGKAV